MQLGQVLMIGLAAPGTYLLLAVLQRVERSMLGTGPDGDWPGRTVSPEDEPRVASSGGR